jgi:Acetyltransferase (GNAT) domain
MCVSEGEKVTLLDGSEISIRRLCAGDETAVLELHQQLTDREQYMRFFVFHPKHLEEFARKMVECSETQCSLGAFEPGQLIGVASYFLVNEPDVAEVAIAVAHEDHLRGVATALLRCLGKVALSNGIQYFDADILAENFDMRRVISDAAWRHTTRFDGDVLHIRIDLNEVNDPIRPQVDQRRLNASTAVGKVMKILFSPILSKRPAASSASQRSCLTLAIAKTIPRGVNSSRSAPSASNAVRSTSTLASALRTNHSTGPGFSSTAAIARLRKSLALAKHSGAS